MNERNHDHEARISAYLDGQMTNEERLQFESELASDALLQREVELLGALRTRIRTHAPALRQALPPELERSIRLALVAERETKSTARSSAWWASLLDSLRRPAFAIPLALSSVAAVVITVMLVLEGSRVPVMREPVVNLYEASYSNFNKVVKGELKLAIQTSDVEQLRSFFREQGVKYEVFFPEVSAELQGGVVSEHQGRRYAHLVYTTNGHLVYIFEVDMESIRKRDVAMHPAVADDLKHSEWHWEERPNVGTMFVWESNSVVCSAVSDLRTQELSALFTLDKL